QRASEPARPQLGESRAMITTKAEQVLLFSTERNLARDFLGKRLALWSNLNLLDAVPQVNGSSTLQLREEKQIESLLYGDAKPVARGLIDFLAVSKMTDPACAIDWSSRSNYCPMVTCGQEPIFASPQQTLDGLATPVFDPRKIVYLPLQAKALVTASKQPECKILHGDFSARQVEIAVETKAPTLVAIAQPFYHCWRASVAGKPVPLLSANHAFQAVEVPIGASKVLLRYED